MFIESFKKALDVMLKKPFVLWGLSLMSSLLTGLVSILFIGVPALSMGVSFLITCGMTKVYLDGLDEKEVYSDQLFSAFNKNCFRIAGGMAWKTLWIFIWALIPIVGPFLAIYKMYEYRFVPYILVNQPEVTATEALRISKKQTEGLKAQMFLADLCFVGATFIVFLVLGLFALIPFIGVLFGMVLFIVSIVYIALSGIFSGLYQAYFYKNRNTTSDVIM